MAIAQMTKIMIVTHRTEASNLLEALQREGICQILNAEEAMVSKDWPEFAAESERPRDLEHLLSRLSRSIAFLKPYAKSAKGLAEVLSPRTVVDQQAYNQAIDQSQQIHQRRGSEPELVAAQQLSPRKACSEYLL